MSKEENWIHQLKNQISLNNKKMTGKHAAILNAALNQLDLYNISLITMRQKQQQINLI